MINQKGDVIADFKYDRIFNEYVIAAQQSGKWGLLSLEDGREVRLNDSYYGYFPALVQEGDRWMYIDPTRSTSSFHITGKTKLGY